MTATAIARQQDRKGGGYWLTVAGLAALTIPTFITLGREVWSAEGGVQGPIVLATGAWMLARQRETIEALRRPGSVLLGALFLLATLAFYTIFLVYPSCSVQIFRYFICDDLNGLGESGASFMRVDLSVDCVSAEYRAFGAYALAMLVVWPIGVPVFYCLVLYFSRHDLRRLRHLEAEAENPEGG